MNIAACESSSNNINRECSGSGSQLVDHANQPGFSLLNSRYPRGVTFPPFVDRNQLTTDEMACLTQRILRLANDNSPVEAAKRWLISEFSRVDGVDRMIARTSQFEFKL